MLKLEYNVRHMGKMLAVSVANVIYQTQRVRETTSYTLLGKITER